MPTRRSFLQVAAMAAAVPNAIADLKSRKNEAKPIAPEERQARVARAQQLMAEQKINSICLAGGTSLEYFSGVHWGNNERMFIMVIPMRGEPFYIAPGFEEERSREQIALGNGGAHAQVFTWQEDESPYTLTASSLKERGLLTGKMGIEETVKFVFADSIGKAAPTVTITSATPITAACRMIKSPHEMQLLRLASQVTLAAYEAAWKSMKEGMTQQDFGALVAAGHMQQGFQGYASVQVGKYSALPHGSVTKQYIREGTILLIDGGCRVEGYESDISRTFVLGKPTDKMKQVFDIVLRAQSAALAQARLGVAAGSVDAAARKVIVDAGYGPDYKYFTHRVGHGLGMDGHEWPYLVKDNPLLLQTDMTFSDEPGVYIPGEFGVRLEDDMHITVNGAELLTPQSKSIELPFA